MLQYHPIGHPTGIIIHFANSRDLHTKFPARSGRERLTIGTLPVHESQVRPREPDTFNIASTALEHVLSPPAL